MNTIKQLICLGFLGLLTFNNYATISPRSSLSKLYHSLHSVRNDNMVNRLEFFSEQFIGKPYLLGALGEGKNGRFDQSPLYRTDAFDCETFVDTVLALALSQNASTFKQCINQIRYAQANIDFLHRNHFTDLDWNQNNQKQGLVKDITHLITDKHHQPIAKIAIAWIDKPSWYTHFTPANLKLGTMSKPEQDNRLIELKKKGSELPRSLVRTPYLPFTALFNNQGSPNQHLFSQIPSGAIIEIIRPNWNIKEKIGTNLNVSHLGFVFRKNGQLFFYQASSQYGRVVSLPLINYLREALLSPTIKGINVQIIVPKRPFDRRCII